MFRSYQSRSRQRARVLALIALLTTLIAGLVTPTAASAAVTYLYMPSHPMNWRATTVPPHACTGGWGIRSSINLPYFLTAGHCLNTGAEVWGTTGKFGYLHMTHFYSGSMTDTAIVQPDPGTDGRQEIPGIGRTVGKDGNVYSTTGGNAIAVRGANSGLLYGTTYSGWETWYHGKRIACANYPTVSGDSGSPVFYHRGDQVWALGVHVGIARGKACFVTIDDLLAEWNAWLPVFSSKAAKNPDAKPDVLLKAPEGPSPADALPLPSPGELVAQ